jgi:hypothetical protein
MQYRPNPDTECCSGNIHRIMPNYVARMWMRADEETIAAVLYGPSTVTTSMAGTSVTITQETEFLFEEDVHLHIGCTDAREWTLRLRIPRWAEGASIRVNGDETDIECPAGQFVDCRRTFADGDRIDLHLPMRVQMTRWPEGGVALERGPLVYSLDIETETVIEAVDGRSCPGLPPKSLYPAGPWNYGIDLSQNDVQHIEVERLRPVGDRPWSPEAAPLALKVPVRSVERWHLVEEE